MLVEFGVVVRICGALYCLVVRYVLLVVRCRCVLLSVAYHCCCCVLIVVGRGLWCCWCDLWRRRPLLFVVVRCLMCAMCGLLLLVKMCCLRLFIVVCRVLCVL